MSVFKILYFIILCTAIVFGKPASVIVQLPSSKDNSGKCVGGLLGLDTLKSGEFKTLEGLCIRVMCDENSVMHYHSCASHIKKLLPNCRYIYLKIDSYNQYPDCCPYIDCYGNLS